MFFFTKVIYLVIVILLGILAVVVSLWDKFGTPRYRPFRASRTSILSTYSFSILLFNFASYSQVIRNFDQLILLRIYRRIIGKFDFVKWIFKGVFIFFGLSGIAPATHYSIVNGWEKSINEAALGWLLLMGESQYFLTSRLLNLRQNKTECEYVCFSVCLFLSVL